MGSSKEVAAAVPTGFMIKSQEEEEETKYNG
jgi:hypothetical protein